MKKVMEDFERRFAEMLTGSVLPMDEILRYVAEGKGKRLRPQLVFLCAELFGEVNETTWDTALFVETVHTATLIHDDVVDHSDVRRGRASVNAKWNNVSAVLAGDYLLAKAMLQLSNPEEHMILKEMLNTTMAMSEGELMQNAECEIRNAELLAPEANSAFRIPNSELYLDVISRKTALLFRACCMGGAMSVSSPFSVLPPIRSVSPSGFRSPFLSDFGLNLGLVFQMRDDILDADDPATTALAERLLPEYLDKALKALDALAPYAINKDVLSSLRELTVFCATRNH